METDNESSLLLKYDTPALSDVLDGLGINGGCAGIIPRGRNTDIAGRAYTVKFEPVPAGISAKAGDYIDDVTEGSVVVIDNGGIENCTVWGDILTLVAQIRKLAGTVIDGACRDLGDISASDYPVFSKHVFMKTGKNRVRLASVKETVALSGAAVKHGDFVRADKSGVLVIPQEAIGKVLEGAKIVAGLEDQIRDAVRAGMRLDEARKRFRYNQPLK